MGRDIDKIYKHILEYGWHAISQYTHIDWDTGGRTVSIELSFRDELTPKIRYYLYSIVGDKDE